MRQRIPDRHRGFAKSMRADATRAESLLWQALKNRQLEGFKFRRQVPMDGYILDLVCFDVRLIIEVDGHQHAESASDRLRDTHFRQHGFRVLRFWNDEVEQNLDAVCGVILGALRGD